MAEIERTPPDDTVQMQVPLMVTVHDVPAERRTEVAAYIKDRLMRLLSTLKLADGETGITYTLETKREPTTPPDDTTDLRDRMDREVPGLYETLANLPRVKITPETVTQSIIDNWYKREAEYRAELERLRAELAEANAAWECVLRRADKAEWGLCDSERRRIEQGVATGEAIQHAEQAEAERDALKAAIERVRTLANQAMKKAAYSRDFVDAGAILAALDIPTDRDESDDEADDEQQPCEWFKWIGQSFAFCDGCGRPAWQHKGHLTGGNPFTKDPGVGVEWKPGEAEAIRAKWGRHESHGGEADDD